MRKSIFVLVLLSLLFVLCGCGGGASANGNNNADSSPLPKLPEEGETENLIEEAAPSPIIPVSVNDEIKFGSYEQDTDKSNGPEAIEWVVLDIEDNVLLLISKYCLDCQKYNDKTDLVAWNNCTLRDWLNSDFYDSAFDENEQALIRTTHVDNSDSEGRPGCSDTEDKIYLLKYEEIKDYFGSQQNAICKPTKYAVKKGVVLEEDFVRFYWLRGIWERNVSINSKGNAVYQTKVGLVYSDSGENRAFAPATTKGIGVRPVMWVQWDESLAS